MYGFAGNDPINNSDPLGLYEADFHLGVTYVIGRKAGFGEVDARAVAFANENVDRYQWTKPTHQGRKGNWSVVYAFHFPLSTQTGRVEEGTSPANNGSAWDVAQRARNLEDLGTGLHTLQDSLSHSGAYYGNFDEEFGQSPWGPVIQLFTRDNAGGVSHDVRQEDLDRFGRVGGLSAADWTFLNPEKAARAAKATFEAMIEYRLRAKEIDATEAAALQAEWPALRPELEGFFTASTVDGKKKWFASNHPEILHEIPWSDVKLPDPK